MGRLRSTLRIRVLTHPALAVVTRTRIGHSLAVWGARVDPQFMQVFARHIKHRPLLDV